MEEWQSDSAPFCAIHINHRGPLLPPSNRNTHCVLIVDSLSRILKVYTVTSTGPQATIAAVEKRLLHFGFPQSFLYDSGTAFLNTDFANWFKQLGNTLRPRTAHSPWTNSKVKTQMLHIAYCWRSFLTNVGTNWASLAPKFAFAHKTNVNYTTGKTSYKIVFGAKPQFSMFVKLELYLNNHKICYSEFCADVPRHTHDENSTRNEPLQKLLRPQFFQALLDQERDFKRIHFYTFKGFREQTARSHAYRSRFKL